MPLLETYTASPFYELIENDRWIVILGIILGTYLFTRLLRYFLRRYFRDAADLMRIDPTNYHFFSNGITFLVYMVALIAIIYVIPSLRALSLTLLASAGIFAVVLGLACQQAFSNIIGGIFIVIFKPFRVNDVLTIGQDLRGVVEDITLRHTVIRDFQYQRIIIPNTVISSETIVNSNFGDQWIRRHVEFLLPLEFDTEVAERIIREEALAHPDQRDGRTEADKEEGVPEVIVRVLGFEESGARIRAYVWAEDPMKAFAMHCDLNRSVKKRLEAEGMRLGYPHRRILMDDSQKDA